MLRGKALRRHSRRVAIRRMTAILEAHGREWAKRPGEQDAIFFKQGWDGYYSRRPFAFSGFGKDVKRLTHHAERARERRMIREEWSEAVAV